MARRYSARVFALLSLAAVALTVILLVGKSTGSDGGSTGSTTTGRTATSPTTTGTTTRTTGRSGRKTYTVRSGDNLSTVAESTGVSVDELQSLNPDVDANALRVGQRLKLTPGGA